MSWDLPLALHSSFLRMQDEFLDAPVKQLGDEEDVLGWAGDLVDPAELLELFAGFAEDAKNLAVEAEFVDAAGKCI